MWGVISVSKSTTIVSICNINFRCKSIRGITGYFLVWNYHQEAWELDSNLECHNKMERGCWINNKLSYLCTLSFKFSCTFFSLRYHDRKVYLYLLTPYPISLQLKVYNSHSVSHSIYLKLVHTDAPFCGFLFHYRNWNPFQ